MIQMDEERRRQIDGDTPPMTRAEWIEYARAECEKQLPVIEEPEMVEEVVETEEPLHAVYVPIDGEDGVSDEDEEMENPYMEKEEEYENPILHAMQYDNVIPLNDLDKIKWSYMTKLGVRVVAALVIALFAISLDYFGIKSDYISSEKVKNAITRNDSIEQIEESVSTFAKDTILPLISGKDKQENATNDTGQTSETNK